MPNDPHGPNRFSTYWQVHENRMSQFRGRGVIGEDTIGNAFIPGYIRLAGEIACLGQIVISVEKRLDVVGWSGDDPVVQTSRYSYAAWVRGNHCFLRHDGEPHHRHPDGHHRHIGDWRSGEESIEWVGRENWPTLGQFIEKVIAWYWEHRGELPNPDAFPTNLATYLRS